MSKTMQIDYNGLTFRVLKRGRIGFDVDKKPEVHAEDADYLVNPAANFIVANDDNYALAA